MPYSARGRPSGPTTRASVAGPGVPLSMTPLATRWASAPFQAADSVRNDVVSAIPHEVSSPTSLAPWRARATLSLLKVLANGHSPADQIVRRARRSKDFAARRSSRSATRLQAKSGAQDLATCQSASRSINASGSARKRSTDTMPRWQSFCRAPAQNPIKDAT